MDALLNSVGHPSELYALIQYKLLDSKIEYATKDSIPPKESKEFSRAMCYYFLNKTSRSFARVIQELDDELCHPVCIFYLVLRGLDTIEDDMTIDIAEKVELLENFHKYNQQRGWSYQGNGPQEKDRILLQEYHVVVEEFLNLKPKYQNVITDITKKMGAGMAEFIEAKKVVTLEDYNLYTHYVAGLVGIGLTRLFVESGLEKRTLLDQLEIANEMGLFLQKTNILKDYLTDIEEGRLFWPKGNEDVSTLAKPENLDKALACLNHLCHNALELVPSCLEYLSKLENKSVFQFAAIPQLMAIASIALFYNNPIMFSRKANKIRRGLAVKLIFAAKNFENVKQIYYEYALELNKKARMNAGKNPLDKSLIRTNLACANIIRWINNHDQKLGRSLRKSESVNSWIGLSLLIAVIIILASLPVVQ